MRIGEIAQKVHVSRSLIRYYEKTGILPCPARSSCGYRDYGATDLARIQLITGARRLGCSFAEIKALLAVQAANNVPSADILELLARRMIEVGKEMDRLGKVQMELSRLRECAVALAQPEETHDDRTLTVRT